MKTLEEIKDEYAEGWAYENWDEFLSAYEEEMEVHCDKVARRYAQEALKVASQQAFKIEVKEAYGAAPFSLLVVDKESILNIELK